MSGLDSTHRARQVCLEALQKWDMNPAFELQLQLRTKELWLCECYCKLQVVGLCCVHVAQGNIGLRRQYTVRALTASPSE